VELILSIFLNIVYLVSLLSLIALGLGVVYGLLGVINMAHGEFVAIGAYSAVFMTQWHLSYWLALPVAAVLGMAVGMLLEVTLIRRLTRRPLDAILVTLGLSLVLQQILQIIFGPAGRSIPNPVSGSLNIFGVAFPAFQAVVIAVVITTVVAVFLFFGKSDFGVIVRAILQNREAAATNGVNAGRYNLLAFGLGSALAAFAGCLIAPSVNVLPQMGAIYLAPAFIAVILGGSARLAGVVAGALFMGGLQIVFATFATQTVARAAVLVLAIFLIRLRPGGLVRQQRERVA
jgi:urea transport system permease protein